MEQAPSFYQILIFHYAKRNEKSLKGTPARIEDYNGAIRLSHSLTENDEGHIHDSTV